MAKIKTVYVCNNCGAESPKWIGKCPACGEWNSYVEEVVSKDATSDKSNVSAGSFLNGKAKPSRLIDVQISEENRISTQSDELDRVLGGGIVPGSLTLLGGEPGIGKSTLLLQTVLKMGKQKILYVSGEESIKQLKLRADRLNDENSNAWFLSETSLEEIFVQVKNVNPDLLIVDSIQTISTENLDSSPGSISQVKETAASLLRFAKETNVPVILIGHINKEGSIAGPKVLEHIVDTVLLFEGDKKYFYRIVRSMKNRFGDTSEIGIFEMRQDGLREVANPSEMLLSSNTTNLSGTAIASTVEGIRPFLVEVQALVSTAAYGMPQRSATGFDTRRLNMLLAVLEKRAGFKIAQKDVFLNIAGGLKVKDTAIDLSVMAAILSSSLDLTIDKDICMAGEVGLSGEIRPVMRMEQRIQEAEKLGFRKIIVPYFKSVSSKISKFDLQICQVNRVEEAFNILFKK